MKEIQSTTVNFSVKSLVIMIVAIISIVTSFWLGYGNVIGASTDGFRRLEIKIDSLIKRQDHINMAQMYRDLRQDAVIQGLIDEDRRINERINNLRR